MFERRQHFRQPAILGVFPKRAGGTRPIVATVEQAQPILQNLLGLPASRNLRDRAQSLRSTYTRQSPIGCDHILEIPCDPHFLALTFLVNRTTLEPSSSHFSPSNDPPSLGSASGMVFVMWGKCPLSIARVEVTPAAMAAAAPGVDVAEADEVVVAAGRAGVTGAAAAGGKVCERDAGDCRQGPREVYGYKLLMYMQIYLQGNIYCCCKYANWSKFTSVRLTINVSPREWVSRMLQGIE